MATRDYTLGKGKVLFKKSGTSGYMDLGNAPAFTVNVTIDKLEHFGSRSGISKKDLEVITKLGMGGAFTLDEPKPENLAMFVMSDAGATADGQASGSTVAAPITSPTVGNWYPLVLPTAGTVSFPAAATPDTANGATSALALSDDTVTGTVGHTYKVVVITAGASGTIKIAVDDGDFGAARSLGTSFYTMITANEGADANGIRLTFSNHATGDIYTFTTTSAGVGTRITNLSTFAASGKVENTDYVLDYAAGLIMPLTSGTITPTTTTYAANTGRTKTLGGTLTSLKGDLYFVGDPPQGRIVDIMGFCSLTPNGDLATIGEDWMQVQFNVEFLEVAGIPELIQVIDRGKAGTL